MSSTEYKLHVVARQRTPSILMKNANLVRKEKRTKQMMLDDKAREEAAIANGKPPPKKKAPGRFTIALKKKQAQRGKQVSPE
jgi:hypothetical protein